MTMKVKDVPEGTEETPAMRLRQAREDKGLTRTELASRTGIPPKSIEKFEYGSQEPSLSRLQALSEALGVTTQWIMGDEDNGDVSEAPSPSSETTPALLAEPVNDNDPMQRVRDMLERLDDMRVDEFQGVQRQAMALADDVRAALRYLEPGDLLAVASERGLYQGECKDESDILDLFSENVEEAQAYCGNIEERILDTAIIGVDLYAVECEPLIELAEEMEIESPGIFGWGDHKDFVPVIRSHFQAEVLSGNKPGRDFVGSLRL